MRSKCCIDPVKSRVASNLWQGDQEVDGCSHRQKGQRRNHGEASPDDQLGGGEAAALLPSHLLLNPCLTVPVMLLGFHRCVALGGLK